VTLVVRRIMTMLTLAGFCVVAWLALAGPSSGQVPTDLGARPDEATVAVYEVQCSPCHGSNGEGGVGPALTSSALSLEERTQLITDGRGGMPSFASGLSPDEINSLALMVDSFAVAEIYATQCAPCHGAAGGGGIGPNLLTSNMSAEDQLAIVTDGGGGMPAFGPTLDAERLQAVVVFAAGFASEGAAAEALYRAQCAQCHGAAGEGGVGPDLQSSTLSRAEVIALVSHGAGSMSTFGGTLAPDEIRAVVAYAMSLRVAAPEEPTDDEALDERSAEIYAEQCAGCHGDDASGGVAPSLQDTGLAVEAVVSIISEGEGTMPAFGDTLSDSEIEALAGWLAGPGAGGDASLAVGAELYAANCATCHGVDASGGSGPALTTTTLTSAELATVVAAGQGAMPAFSETLSAEDITALTAFMEAAVEAAIPPEPPIVPAALSGQALFISNCATCHGADAGGGSAPSLTQGKHTANEIISQVYGGHVQGMPAFEGVLTATEVQEVARYVLELPESGADGISLGAVALVVGLIIIVVLGGLWAAGRLGPPPADATADAPPAWQEPLEPLDQSEAGANEAPPDDG
jgi:mono/diheme cytochrome c family protein